MLSTLPGWEPADQVDHPQFLPSQAKLELFIVDMNLSHQAIDTQDQNETKLLLLKMHSFLTQQKNHWQ